MAENHNFGKRGLVTLLAIVIFGCATADLGWLRNSREVEQDFETLQVPADYRYWYLYLENSPYAVLGLNREYRFEDISWTAMQPGTEVFQKVVGLVDNFPVPNSFTFGAYILDSEGKRIGLWYSSMSAGIRIDPETKQVFITTDTPWMSNDGGADGGRP